MTVQKFTQPDYSSQSGTVYPTGIDKAIAVHHRLAGPFAPHEQDASSPQPDLSVRVDAGFLWDGETLSEVAAQSVSGFTIPSAGQHRIDRVVIDASTGVASRVSGTAATGSPIASAPAIPFGKIPCCQVMITDSDTAILNSMITDERAVNAGPKTGMVKLASGSVSAAATLDIVMTSYTAYKNKVLVLSNFLPATDNQNLLMQVSTDGGGSYIGTASYDYVSEARGINSNVLTSVAGAGSTSLNLTNAGAASNVGNTSAEGVEMAITMFNTTSATRRPRFMWDGVYVDTATNGFRIKGGGVYLGAQDTDAVRILFSSGNIAEGDWVLYGYN